ncbi:MAG: tyrosine-type recombinase/integrase [Mangrovibacterium sp.]
MAGAIKYKDPKIVRARRGWFISLPYEYPDQAGKYKRFEISAGINYIHDLKEREKEAQILLKEVRRVLQAGFDPFITPLEKEFIESMTQKVEAIKKIEEAEIEAKKGWTIAEGIKKFEEYCEKKNLSPNTIRTYKTFINNFDAWLEETEQKGIIASEITEDTIQEFLDQQFDEEEWSSRTYNNHISFFFTLFARIEKLEKKVDKGIRYAIDISEIELKKDRAEKNRYYAPVVAEKVKKELTENPDLFNYVKWIFFSCMRPREIRLLQINHIDVEARQIKAIAPTAKTGDRFVPICDELMALIESMKLMKLPVNYYVFGKGGAPSKERMSTTFFIKKYKPMKDRLGLDEKYTLYGWKHTRVVNLLMAGFTDHEVMSLTGHSDYKSFMAYKRELMVDTSAMKGKTIEF